MTMKKGQYTRTDKHRKGTGERMKKYYNENPISEEKRKHMSEGMKLFWEKIKELQNKNDINQ